MKRCLKCTGLLITLLISFFFSSAFAALTIDHDAGTVTHVDGDQTWVYTLASKNWTWDNGENTWSYDDTTKAITDTDTGSRWVYDATYDIWVDDPAGSYDVTTSGAFAVEVWRYVSSTKRWHHVTRQEGDTTTFTTVTDEYWEYDNTHSKWVYSRAAEDDWQHVVTSSEWTFDTGLGLEWTQTAPAGAGGNWEFLRETRDWSDVNTENLWEFYSHENDEAIWHIIDEPVSDGGLWDRVQWKYRLLNGSWGHQEVKDVPLTYGPLTDWGYDSDSHLWYQEGEVNGVPDTSTTGQRHFPHFPPTPFATQKAIIEHTIDDLLQNGIIWGSSDGTGDGLVDVSSNSFVTNGQFVFDAITKLSWVDTVKLKGDLELLAEQDATLTLGDGTPTGDVIVTPSDDATFSQIIFNVSAGKTLEVIVQNDTAFLARDTVPLFITFRGRGKTAFRLPSGKTVTFGPTDPEDGEQGVRVQVLMDLLLEDVDDRKHQLVFEPYSYEEQSGDGALNTDQGETTWIMLGRHSSLSFISPHVTGELDPDTPGYGVVAFDVAHAGVGRTVLDIATGKSAGDALDAGVNIYGNLITGSGDDDAVVAADFRQNVQINKRAGMRAIVRIIDDVAFKSVIPDASNPTAEQAGTWVARDVEQRRGLVVLNHCRTYPRLLSNLEGADSLQESGWAQHAKPYHSGFILGNNGRIDISHNLFLDYVCATVNHQIDAEYLGGTGATTAQVKMRNPSALIVDGFGQYLASADPATWDMEYTANETTRAEIVLRGSAGLFSRCGASSHTGVLIEDIQEVTGEPDKLDATIGTATYNGVYAPVLQSDGTHALHESILVDASGNPITSDDDGLLSLDGEHALIFEGKCTIKSILGRFGFAPNGYLNIPSLRLDHTGTEIAGEV